MARQANDTGSKPLHVSLVALPDAAISTLAGIYDLMSGAALMGVASAETKPPFRVEIVGEIVGPLLLASGVPITVQRAVGTIEKTDIVIVPSVLLKSSGWKRAATRSW